MKQTSIPTLRKYIYFYVLVLLATVAIVLHKPEPERKSQAATHAVAVNKPANTLSR